MDVKFEDLYRGASLTLVGGRAHTDWSSLTNLGFELIEAVPLTCGNGKQHQRIRTALKGSTLGLTLVSCISHEYCGDTHRLGRELGVPVFDVPGAPTPMHVAGYLIQRYEAIAPRIIRAWGSR